MMTPMKRELWIGLVLVAATLAVYAPVGQFGFVEFDDREYVTQNPQVQSGLSPESLAWALTTGHASNWHPLTWISHMVDCGLFGLNAGWHHWMSLLFHVANVLLIFVLFTRMTREPWRSGFVAALFAIHPLHVESVAWIAERKDVLCTLFSLVTILSYVRYVEKPGTFRYLTTLFSFALALLSKPMAVTLPMVLLLIDFWPLRRLERIKAPGKKPSVTKRRPITAVYLLREKIPFLALSVCSSVVTLVVQRAGGAVVTMQKLPLGARLENALTSCIRYLGKIVWPDHLVVFYPFPREFAAWQVAGAALVLAGISFWTVRLAGRHPYLAVGWFWYAGMLVPVIGLVQVGLQSMADRYTYLPMVGISIMAAWGVPVLVSRSRLPGISLRIAVPAILVVYAIVSSYQVRVWRDTMTLFTHARDAVENNYVALNGLGSLAGSKGDFNEAIAYYRKAIEADPDYVEARTNLGVTLIRVGRADEAIGVLQESLRRCGNCAEIHYDMGVAYFSKGRLAEAISCYENELRSNPRHTNARYNLAITMAASGRTQEAVSLYYDLLKSNPDHAEAHNNLGTLLFNEGKVAEAAGQFADAVRIKPDYADARRNLAIARQALQSPGTPRP